MLTRALHPLAFHVDKCATPLWIIDLSGNLTYLAPNLKIRRGRS